MLLSTHYRKSIVSYAVTPLTESELSVNGWRKGIPLDPELDSRFSAAFLPEQAPVGLSLMGFSIDFEQSKDPENKKEHESYTPSGV